MPNVQASPAHEGSPRCTLLQDAWPASGISPSSRRHGLPCVPPELLGPNTPCGASAPFPGVCGDPTNAWPCDGPLRQALSAFPVYFQEVEEIVERVKLQVATLCDNGLNDYWTERGLKKLTEALDGCTAEVWVYRGHCS